MHAKYCAAQHSNVPGRPGTHLPGRLKLVHVLAIGTFVFHDMHATACSIPGDLALFNSLAGLVHASLTSSHPPPHLPTSLPTSVPPSPPPFLPPYPPPLQVVLIAFGTVQAITTLDIGVVGNASAMITQFHRFVGTVQCFSCLGHG